MTIQKLRLRQFTAFEDIELTFCPGINVLIGGNSTGKTHLLKAMYTVLKTCERWKLHEQDRSRNSNGRRNSNIRLKRLNAMFQEKLSLVFKPDSLARLVHLSAQAEIASIHLVHGAEQNEYVLSIDLQTETVSSTGVIPEPTSVLFIPSQEFLSTYEGFISSYLERESSFDETYYDLSLALNSLPLRKQWIEEVDALLEPLQTIVGGKITLEQGGFYIETQEGKLEAHLVSEGHRKIAQLIYLIRNGSLEPNSILFWDEPEAQLNPASITIVVKFLRILAEYGVQIFLATHDYLLTQQLSLLGEYPTGIDVKFFSLHRIQEQSTITVEIGNSLSDIDNNPIVNEYAAQYDREVELFQNSQPMEVR